MADMLLSKPKLAPGYIDCSVGEPYVVREALFRVFNLSEYTVKHTQSLYEYPFTAGHAELVRLLEEKHKAPIIITNGATQALGATFHALHKMGKVNLGMRTPFWARIPSIAKIHQLNPLTSFEGADANILILPNNPDGYISNQSELKSFEEKCKEDKVPLIHDAAYFSHIYMPPDRLLNTIGDVQIYSVSKSLGLSGIRIGYCVIKNTEFYGHIKEYVESMTVGASIISQEFLCDLTSKMKSYPTLVGRFEHEARIALKRNKTMLLNLKPGILEIPLRVSDDPGMFGWYKALKPEAFDAAKVNVAWGAPFGDKDYIRLNLALSENVMSEVIKRFNEQA